MKSVRGGAKDIAIESIRSVDKRVLLLAPTAKDSEITSRILLAAGLECVALRNPYELSKELDAGVGAVLLTEEFFSAAGADRIFEALANQPQWSEIPIVMMMKGAIDSPDVQRMMSSRSNVTLLDRPATMRSLVSAVKAAIRGRMRQYQIRDQMDVILNAEQQARDLQQQLELAVEASALGTFHCEMPLGKIVWNDRCKLHFWLDPEVQDVDIDMFYSLLHPDDRERTRLAVGACVNEGKNYDIEYRTMSATGQVRWVRATGRTFYDPGGKPLRFDGTTRDITQYKLGAEERRKLLESERAARLEAERLNNVKDEFLSTLSHELRTPLTAILGWTQLLEAGKDDPATRAHALGVIARNVHLQTQLIDDLLDVSRITSGKVRLDIQDVNLSEIIDTAIESVKPAASVKSIRLEKVIDPGVGPISGDPGRLQQVLWNLLANAIKFSDKDGSVHVVVERVDAYVEIRVSDNGQGISPDFLPIVFSRFSQADSSSTRKYGGLGLGLSIVKSLIEMHGGSVAAKSEGEGKGATFTVRLPLQPLQGSEREPSPAGESTDSALIGFKPIELRGVKVLVVDDDPETRGLIERFLVACEAIPVLAESAEDALSLVAASKPDIIVSDVGMPGQDGYSLIRSLRSQGIQSPAVALTAFARADDRIRALQAGFQAHLPKPFEPMELVAMIASLSGHYDKAGRNPDL